MNKKQMMIQKMKEKEFNNKFIPDYWITINPFQVNSNDKLILKAYNDAIIKYYKKQLGKRFYEKKQIQLEQMYCLENGKLVDFGIRQPHLHILLKMNEYNNLPKLLDFLSMIFKRRFRKSSIKVEEVDKQEGITKEFYIEKESGRQFPSKLFTHFTLQQGINY